MCGRILQEWDHSNFLVDLSGFYANCKATTGEIRAERKTPQGEDVMGMVGKIQGTGTHVDATTGYIEELIKDWMSSHSYDRHVSRSVSPAGNFRDPSTSFICRQYRPMCVTHD